MTDETRSHSGVRIDDRGWGRYLDIPLACPKNRERYTCLLCCTVFEQNRWLTSTALSRRNSLHIVVRRVNEDGFSYQGAASTACCA